MINIQDKLMQQLVLFIIDNPSDVLDCLWENGVDRKAIEAGAEKLNKMFLSKTGDSYLSPVNDELMFHVYNTEFTDLMEFGKESGINIPFSKLKDEYLDWMGGIYSTENHRKHAKQLRDFAEQIDKQCDALDSEELDNE